MYAHDELRLECLKLAVPAGTASMASVSPPNTKAILERARVFADFVIARDTVPKPMEAQPATPETEADPHNPNVPGHEVTGHVSPPTT